MRPRHPLLAVCVVLVALLAVPSLAWAASAGGQGPVEPPQRSTTGPTPPASVRPAGGAMPGGAGEVLVAGVPTYYWHDGCGPTAVGMIVGYYDAHGWSLLVPGDASSETAAVDQMIASHTTGSGNEHFEDYALPMDDRVYPNPPLLDMSSLNPTGAHASDSVADFMHTSWSSEGMYYGWSWSDMIGPAFTGYVNKVASQYAPTYDDYYMSNGSLSWTLVKGEIAAARPLVFLVDSDGDGGTDHFVTIIGYRETYGYPEYACRDTWYAAVRWQRFRAMSSSYDWGVWGGTTFSVADIAAPSTTASGADALWHNSPVTVTFSASDPVPIASGVAYTEYQVDGGPFSRGASVTVPAPAGTGHVYTVGYRSADNAGNVEATKTVTVKIDTRPPVTADNAGDLWHAAPFTLTLSPSDADSGMSGGLAKTEYSQDGGVSWVSGASLAFTSVWKRGGGSGTFPVAVRSTDAVGNVEAPHIANVMIDTSAPVSSDDAPVTAQSSAVTVDFSGADAYSGIAGFWYSVDYGTWTQGSSVTISAPTNHSNDGLHTVRYYAVDNAGNRQIGYNVCAVTINTAGGGRLLATPRLAQTRLGWHLTHKRR